MIIISCHAKDKARLRLAPLHLSDPATCNVDQKGIGTECGPLYGLLHDSRGKSYFSPIFVQPWRLPALFAAVLGVASHKNFIKIFSYYYFSCQNHFTKNSEY